MPTLRIDGKLVRVAAGATVLAAARTAAIDIPTLCHHPAVEPYGGCRLCVVDVTLPQWNGWCKLVVACMYPVEEGLIVDTHSARVQETRAVVLDLLLARSPETPLVIELARAHGIEKTSFPPNSEPTDCVLCGLCTRICDQMGVSAISAVNRGSGREIAPPFHAAPPDCIGCLACATLCPTQCIAHETHDNKRTIWNRTFAMLTCRECGRATLTCDEAQFVAKRRGIPPRYFELCDECKRDELARTVARITERN